MLRVQLLLLLLLPLLELLMMQSERLQGWLHELQR